jgi:hypothetical protein
MTGFSRLTTRIANTLPRQHSSDTVVSAAGEPSPLVVSSTSRRTATPRPIRGPQNVEDEVGILPAQRRSLFRTRRGELSGFTESLAKMSASGRGTYSVHTRQFGQRAVAAAVGLLLAAGVALPAAAEAAEPYKIETFTSHTTDEAGADYTQAAGHPFQNRTAFEFSNHVGVGNGAAGAVEPNEELKDASVTLEPGFIGNPAAAPRCPIGDIPIGNLGSPNGIPTTCPPGSRVGTAFTRIIGPEPGYSYEVPVYNIVTERGYPAQFAFRVVNTVTILSVVPLPRTESYGLTIGALNTPKFVRVVSFDTVFCSYGAQGPGGLLGPGVPATSTCNAPSASTGVPFLSDPLDCSNPTPTWNLLVDSWENAGTYTAGGLPDLADPAWLTASVTSPPVTGCANPLLASQFDAITMATRPLQPGGGPVQADQPSGLAVDLDFPQSNDPTDVNGEAEPDMPQAPEPKDITVKLPAGLSISPSSADGLGACSDQASDPAGDQVHYDSTKPVTCPEASKIGTAVATSPLLALRDPQTDEVTGPEPIPGDVYLLKPHPGDLPFGAGQAGRFRLLIQLENEKAGVNIKLPGVATANPVTGQLTATFTESPQLPSSHITVSLKEGPRAPLATPVTCGRFETTTDLVPWGTPGVPDAYPAASFAVGAGPNGSACANTPGQRPFHPSLVTAGPDSTQAGASSPFTLKLTRGDGEGELSSLEALLPKGLAAKFAGVPYCSDAALATAAARSGREEEANPSCPASRIGSVTVAAGPGSNPFYAHGNAYLAGPYKGAPMSVAVITPAVAGPFDLGTVVVRNALFVEPETAQGRVVSDPFPKIIDGVPLRLRSIEVRLDRANFTLNPTNCSQMSVNATIKSGDGASSSPTVPFQVAGCKNLGFKPQLKLSLKGSTKHAGHPALKAVLTYPRGSYANIARAQVNLPHSEFIDQGNLNKTCTKPVLLAGACPASSVYGQVRAWTPLLEKPLEGPVYLVGGYGYKLPALVAELDGQIKVLLVGKVDSGPNHGIRNTFEAVPDAPVERFELNLKGGPKYSLLENSENLCAKPQKAIASFTAQNGATLRTKPVIANECGKKKHRKAAKGKHHKGKKGTGKKHAKAGKSKGTSSRAIVSWMRGLGF